MLLSDIFDYLHYGELSQLYIGGDDDDTGIVNESYPAVVSHLNMGLIELYKRFPIRQREIDIQLYSTVTEYRLKKAYALVGDTGLVGTPSDSKYLIDTIADPFLDRVLKIERVETDDAAVTDDLPLNDTSEETSVYTVAFDLIRVPSPNNTDILTVHYRAAPDKIVAAGLDPTLVDIPLPESLLEALVYFMASRAHSNTPALDGSSNERDSYMNKFEMSVRKVKELGLIDHVNTTVNRLELNGWV